MFIINIKYENTVPNILIFYSNQNNVLYFRCFTACVSSGIICEDCERDGQNFIEAALRACSRCVSTGKQCVKLFVSVWSADCEENNKQVMLKLSQMKKYSTLPSQMQLLIPIPEATHVAKCLKGSFTNWFLYKHGERFNLSILRTLYNDPDPQIRKKMRNTVTLSAVRNRDRMSVPDLLTINKESVRAVVTSVPRVVQTLIPEPFRLYKRNARGVIEHPTGLCVATDGKFFVADHAKSCVFQGRLHYPVDVSEIGANLKNPQGLAIVCNVLYVADKGNKRVAYIPQSLSVFLKPNVMKVDELRQVLNDRGISTNEMQKKQLMDCLKRWISDEQRTHDVNLVKKFSSLAINRPILSPLAICGCGSDLLFVSDMERCAIFQVSVINNGAVLKGIVLSEIKLNSTALVYGISFSNGNDLYVADSCDEGGLMRVNLSNNETTVLISNGSPNCEQIHDVTTSKDGELFFSDRAARKVRVLKGGTVQDVAGLGQNLSFDGSLSSCSFQQPTALCIEGNTLYVADTAVGRVCLITPTSSL